MCGDFETCFGKGIAGTGCAKMVMGPDFFSNSILFSSILKKPSTPIEKVREENRFRFGDNETRLSFWSAVIPMNIGGQVCREKVANVAGDAPFLISSAISSPHGSCLGNGGRTSDIQQVGSHVGLGRVSQLVTM